MKIRITSNDTELTALITDEAFAEKLRNILPVESSANTYGQELYFDLPIEDELHPDATDVVDPGTVTFWVQGSAMAIPYGPTPASKGDECRLVTDVNPVGRIEGDPERLGQISAGDPIRVVEDNSPG